MEDGSADAGARTRQSRSPGRPGELGLRFRALGDGARGAGARLRPRLLSFLGWRGGKAIAVTYGAWIGSTGWMFALALGICMGVCHGVQRGDAWTVVGGMALFGVFLLAAGAPLALLVVWMVNLGILTYKQRGEFAGTFDLRGWVPVLEGQEGIAGGGLAWSALERLGSSTAWVWELRERTRVIVLGLLLLIALSNVCFLKPVEGRGGRHTDLKSDPRRTRRHKKVSAAPAPQVVGDMDLPLVSVLVPARNEEMNIESCVRSLLAQDYPRYEVVVLNDDSTDGTSDILAGLAASDGRLRVLTGRPLPAGWLGKHWACHQLAEVASGKLLLFTDADTEHHPQMLRDAVTTQRSESSDMLTGMPHEVLGSWGERLVLPVMHWAMLSLLPLGLAHRLRNSLLSMGVGQFMLFTRESYDALGGFAAVRSDPVDDMALARRTKKLGMRWRFVDLSGRVDCRMYRGFRGAVDGLAKSVVPAVRNKLWVLALAVLFIGWLYVAPVSTGFSRLVGLSSADNGSLWTILAMGLALVGWIVVVRRFGYPLYYAFLFPVTIALTMGIATRSAYKFWRGEASWKGRTLPGLGEESSGEWEEPADVEMAG